MTVAHVFWSLGYGGIETMLVNIANAQVKLGADVHIIVVNELMEKSLVNNLDKRVHFHSLGRLLKSKNLWFILKFNYLLHKINPDVIHLHGSEFYAIILDKRMRAICCSTLHALPYGNLRRDSFFANKFQILNFHIKGNVSCIDLIPHVYSISKSVQLALQQEYGVNSTVIENGVLTNNFKQRDDKSFSEDSKMKIVCVSRLDHLTKGQDLLIKAASKMKGNIEVTLIGDGKSRQYLKELAIEYQRGGYQVNFLGKKSQKYIADHLKDFDLFVQPSRNEGFALTVAEAMSAKLPVLVSSGQGPAEVTENNKFGWVFNNGDIDDLYYKLEYIYSHYNEAIKKTTKAYEHVKRRYDVSVTAKSYLEHYLE